MPKLTKDTRRDVKKASMRTGGGFFVGVAPAILEYTDIELGDMVEIHTLPEFPRCLIIKKHKTKD